VVKNEELKRINLAGWPLPDDYLIEIGRVGALWGGLETLLNICIGKLAGFNDLMDPKPFVLVNHASFPQKLDMLGSLCEILTPSFPELAGHGAVIAALRSAQKLRNLYMHHGLTLNPDTGKMEMGIGSARGKLSFKVEEISLEDIRRAAIAVSEAQRALYKLVLRRDVPPPWERGERP
jgi:hypothetical protein